MRVYLMLVLIHRLVTPLLYSLGVVQRRVASGSSLTQVVLIRVPMPVYMRTVAMQKLTAVIGSSIVLVTILIAQPVTVLLLRFVVMRIG